MALDSSYVITALTGKQGEQGIQGLRGETGTSVIAQYSVDGSSNWHSTYASGDIYMRTSTDSGATWSSAVRIVGEKGDKGAKGDKGETGAKGDKGETGVTGASGISIKCDTGTLNYTLQRNKKANYESKTFTLALYQGATLLTPTSSSISTANAKNLSVSKSGTTTLTITAKSTYNGAIPSGYITATLVYNNVSYSMNIPITTNYNGKYLGLASALPSTANIGDYFVASKTFTASNTTYTQAYVYERVCSAANTYAWIVSTEINSVEVFGDILSLASASNNTQAVAIVQRLVASDIFVNNLSAQKILFQHFVASSSVNNKAKVGDQIISMGYNPKDSSDKDFSFMIQKCIQEANSATGQQEVWMKHFWTKFLASGLLTLNLSGCLQANGDVKSNPASVWKKEATFSNFPEEITEFNNSLFLASFNPASSSTSSIKGLTIYKSTDGKNWTSIYSDSTSDINCFRFHEANNTLFFCSGPSGANPTYTLYQYNSTTFLKICEMGGTKGDINSPATLFYVNGNYYYNYAEYADDDWSYPIYKIDFKNKTTSKVCDMAGLFSQIGSNYYSLSLTSIKKINFNGTSVGEEKTLLTKEMLGNYIYTARVSPTRIMVEGQNGEIAVCNKVDFLNGNPHWIKHTIKKDGENLSFSGPLIVMNNNETFVFCSFTSNLAGDIFSTTDFENWTVAKSSSFSNFAKSYALRDIMYSSVLDKFVICGHNSSDRTQSYDGVGIVLTADYTSLSSLSAISQAPYIQSYNLEETGYVKWSNGFLIQWGKITHTSSSTAQWLQATLPISYKSTTSYIGMCSTGLDNNTNAPYAIVNNNNKINEIGIQVRGASRNIRWLTVGYV